MRVLALDLATNTGWAHSCGESGDWDLSIAKDESSGMRLLRLRSKLAQVHAMVGFDLVAFESVTYTGPNMTGASVQSEMVGVLKVWCSDNKVEHVGVNMTEIKRHATGKGNAGKPDMVAAAKKKWPHKTIASHDEADALWLLDYIVTKKLAGIPFS